MHYHEQLTFTKYWKYFFYKFITCFQNILFGKWGWYSILKTYHSFRNRYFLWNRIFSTYMRFFRRKIIYPEQMKPVSLFWKKYPLDYHVTIGSALTSKMTNYVSHFKKKRFWIHTIYAGKFPSGTRQLQDRYECVHLYTSCLLMPSVRKWTLLLVIKFGSSKLMLLTECIKSWPTLLWIGHDLRRLNLLFIETDQPRNIKIEVGF